MSVSENDIADLHNWLISAEDDLLDEHRELVKASSEYREAYAFVLNHITEQVLRGNFKPMIYLGDAPNYNEYSGPLAAALSQFGEVETRNDDIALCLHYGRKFRQSQTSTIREQYYYGSCEE